MLVPLQSPTELHHMVQCVVPLVRFDKIQGDHGVETFYHFFFFRTDSNIFFLKLIMVIILFTVMYLASIIIA